MASIPAFKDITQGGRFFCFPSWTYAITCDGDHQQYASVYPHRLLGEGFSVKEEK